MVKDAIRYVFILLVLFLIFYFIYPTRYEYVKLYDPLAIVKADRLSDDVWIWQYEKGWKKVEVVESD